MGPDGVRLDRDTLLGALQKGYGKNPAFQIEIRNVEVLHALPSHLLVSYEEWQWGALGRGHNVRRSTALLTRDMRWLYVEESWLP